MPEKLSPVLSLLTPLLLFISYCFSFQKLSINLHIL
ncbi:unnamed protein product [Musa acuminata subsp. malaccensis]|uniref:(wild Malaysian banana) hypothetical protein n=1 Tax=Musa acuminata subsp. malaccensis TaxID=214687 RepID=A0A804KEX4_MUSAM|nr:unnamed protein product [Musa acuminata subsp. malaccensis]